MRNGHLRKTQASEMLIMLMAEVTQGDRGALSVIYKQTSSKLFGIILSVVAVRAEAEDVLQDVFITVWEKAGLYDTARGSPLSWLATIARNKAIDRRRKMGGFQEPLPDQMLTFLKDDSLSALDVLERDETSQRLIDCLEMLDAQPRLAILQAFFHGRTYEELASDNAVPLGTMKSWIRRSLANLKGCLQRE